MRYLDLLGGARRMALVAALLGVGLLNQGCSDPPGDLAAIGDPRRGSVLFDREACGSCHWAPGRKLSQGAAGPPLSGFGRRTVIAGMLPNTPDDLVLWLQHPQSVLPGNVMPDMGLSRRDARDIAAYLDTIG